MKSSTSDKLRTRKQTVRNESPQSFGWLVREYFPHKIGFGGPTTFHALSDEAKPKHIRIGNRILIIEKPEEYASRLALLAEKRPIQLRRRRRPNATSGSGSVATAPGLGGGAA